jgi:pyridoxine 5-phosphate synthase
MIELAKEIGVHRIEFYTGPYAENYYEDPASAIQAYVIAANKAHELGLGINAGHDLNLDNLKYFKQEIPFLAEVSIGHAIISDALYLGIENTIQRYKLLLN